MIDPPSQGLVEGRETVSPSRQSDPLLTARCAWSKTPSFSRVSSGGTREA